MTDTPEAGWLPDPDGGGFNRWWDGKHFTKRVQGEPPKAQKKKTTTVVVKEPLLTEPVVTEPVDEYVEEPGKDDETPDATVASAWPIPSTIAAVISGLGTVAAFLLPLGRLPLVIAALGVVGSVVALVLAINNNERRVVAVWGMGIGLVGVVSGVTVGMLD